MKSIFLGLPFINVIGVFLNALESSIQTFALGSNVWVWIVVCRCGYPRASMTNLDHLLFTGSASRFAEFLVCLWLYLLSCCLVQGCSGLFVILNFFF